MTTASRVTETELAARLRLALLRLTRMVRNQRADQSVTLTQLSAMGTLAVRGPLSAGELAQSERVQPPSMTKVLAALEARGLVQREQHPEDRRQAIIAITDEGLQLLDQERELRDVWMTERLAVLSDDERARLSDIVPILDKLAEQQ
jgi:DNA-binding MarR family transcriptional regulator